jgi:hypothetical protein
LWVSEIWLGNTPASTGTGFEIHFELYFLYKCGLGSGMLDSFCTYDWVSFGLIIPLPVSAVGLGFTLNLFFPWMGVRIQHAGPQAHFTMNWVLAWLYSCQYRQWIRNRFFFFKFMNWVRIQHAGPLCHLTMTEFWVDYTPAGTGSGLGIDFLIIFFMTVGEDLACWTPWSLVSEWDLAW